MNRSWLPPGKNCGLCGEHSCRSFIRAVHGQEKTYEDCPFYDEKHARAAADWEMEADYPEGDVLGHRYDFVLQPLPGEISARKIVLPFRGDLVEKLEIREGDLVLGRPMGAGCPIPHVLRVIDADPLTGLLTTWVVGPKFARDGQQEVKDVSAYHMIGFEGIATAIRKEPTLGCRMTFLPGFCMMSLNHTGLVNMVLEKAEGPHIRIEDVRILATRDWD
ncbi:fe-s cluster, putative [Heliomicrobium modesticaldum Ice1]|uniref:Fe-s cluster, putative n=1 Tax=Heliobacterium modesticaldum (strain ATCC 51547 / Ice1) TaxID=498761 RepID=B0TG09_HELMI|nr:(Fe-S)-binding protein [Heliomicrobium modesticaldum]ABZ83166.1 fe-s cluster, putative [Heliomicrobium modesticaldum Ice1]